MGGNHKGTIGWFLVAGSVGPQTTSWDYLFGIGLEKGEAESSFI
jgi:hypothetical protein